jgi:hypothetical protein
MSKKKISNQEKTTTSPVVNVETQTPVVVSENPTLEATTNEEPAELSALEKLKLRAKLMVEVANTLADRIIENAIAKEDRETAFKARRDEISTVVKEKAVLSKEQRLERRKLRREADLAKATANKHKTIPSKEAIVREKANQERLLKLIAENGASTPGKIKSVGKSIGLEKMAKELEICKDAARLEKTRRWVRAHQQKPGKVSEKITKTTKQERVDKAVAAKKSGKAEYEALVAQHEAAKKEIPVDSQIREKAKADAEKRKKHDENLVKIRIARMEKQQKHERYIAKVKEELEARLLAKRKKKAALVVKNTSNLKYMLACTRLNEDRTPYQFYTTFKTCTEKEALKTLEMLHKRKLTSADDHYHSYSLFKPNYMPGDLVKTYTNNRLAEKQAA